ncbi:Thiosulfate sulfurtransferase GlpE [Arsenophonus endosymbiont of Aleurodicus dispersus]|uniref:rhodanese-like domain-containing protein n=1 Tax=Arsenophonus endosymbiont of Aleurodicus dispersus TaxID=235559 RepID=UPI000EAD5827|nr:rhodanese-like domain-containing protein [Arsenophonus endosymbiont of Aleurodicus dispersus]VAY02194.1 Thiosulfate sulfurtransferase GlpE [Arsenophonus endosymbiont of Aleurodicus dispersus]
MMPEIIKFISIHPILSLAWIALLSAVIILTFNSLFAKTKNITCTQAIQLINKEEAITLDLRSREDFCKGHIIDSINLTTLEINDNNIRELEKHHQKPIIVVSANGIEASKSSKQLLQYGFKRVFILKEGITGWSSENLPLASYKK